NLLNQSLSKTLSPGAWQDTYTSFGYNPRDVIKTLVEHPGVYQSRALAYYLKNPDWEAGVVQQGGFGQTPFGLTQFGYNTSVTSRLRMLSHTSFDCVPTDSYQFMVSLGLKQDKVDEKRSAIGFQFYDE